MKPTLKMLLYSKGKWIPAGPDARPDAATSIREIWRFHGNVIDYARVGLALAAGAAVMMSAPFTAAALILGSTLLDWVDGPVARHFNQCTIFGSGVDWLADVLCQWVTLIWWAQLDRRILLVILAFTAVETALSIFDFATTVTGLYPTYEGRLARYYRNPFFAILDWSMPNGSYSNFGTFLWLAYPVFCLVCCLKLAQPAFAQALFISQAVLLVPALLYMWCEVAYLCFMLRNWRELPRN